MGHDHDSADVDGRWAGSRTRRSLEVTTSVLVASAVALVCGAASGAWLPHHGAGRPLLLRTLTVGVLAAVAPTRVPEPG